MCYMLLVFVFRRVKIVNKCTKRLIIMFSEIPNQLDPRGVQLILMNKLFSNNRNSDELISAVHMVSIPVTDKEQVYIKI